VAKGNRKVAVIVGSLRKGSVSRRVARALCKLAPESLHCEIVEIGDLVGYNTDLEDHVPASWAAFREQMQKAEAVLFVTPEYNRSVPGVLKNTIDVGSRPYGASIWEGKPAAIVSVSPGALAAFGANHHLRQSLVFLNMPAMQQPEAYIGHAAELVDDNDDVTIEGTKTFFGDIMEAFEAWIERTARN
jgi:chromate reductase, NAD(P)H dehydrogenase (quinone)